MWKERCIELGGPEKGAWNIIKATEGGDEERAGSFKNEVFKKNVWSDWDDENVKQKSDTQGVCKKNWTTHKLAWKN